MNEPITLCFRNFRKISDISIDERIAIRILKLITNNLYIFKIFLINNLIIL